MKATVQMVLAFALGIVFAVILGAAKSTPAPDLPGRYAIAADEGCIYVMDTNTGEIDCQVKKLWPSPVFHLGTLTRPQLHAECKSPTAELNSIYVLLDTFKQPWPAIDRVITSRATAAAADFQRVAEGLDPNETKNCLALREEYLKAARDIKARGDRISTLKTRVGIKE